MPLKLKDATIALFFGAALYFFYLKYVPLIGPFQALLLPVCLGLALLSALDIRRGTLAFLFLLPLVNGWPYFFGVQQATPHAPAALVLFLFFVWGWLIHKLFPPGSVERALPAPWRAPLLAAGSLTAVSAVVLIWKWANFFPLVSGGIYELPTNVNGVTTGGAAMSTLFHALSYLGGFIFFMILSRDFPWKENLSKALGALGAGLLLAILFGFYQHFFNPTLGNMAFWVRLGQINATFKDPNAFGVWLSMSGPLALGGFFYARGALKALLAAVFGLGLFIFPFIGARSGLLGLGLALAWFAFQAVPRNRKKLLAAAALALVLLAAAFGIARLTHAPLLARLAGSHEGPRAKSGLVNASPERYFLWKEATAMIRDYPLTGVGVGAFIIELPNYYTKDKKIYEGGFAGWRRNDSAENILLQVGAEMGLAGLLAFGWVYWTIGSAIKRGLRRGRAGRRGGTLFLGVAAGLIAFFINSLFHSYIGSFEAQLGFWFLAALLAFLADGEGRDADPPPEPGPVRRGSGTKRMRAAMVLSLAVFGGLLLWNSTHSLSLAERTRIFHLGREFGLYQREKTEDGKEFRWTREYGGLPVKVTGTVMELPLRAAHPGIESAPVKVELFFIRGFFREKLRLGEVSLVQNDWKTVELPTPGIIGEDGILLAEVSRTWNPLKTNGSPDPRNLGVAMGVVSFRN